MKSKLMAILVGLILSSLLRTTHSYIFDRTFLACAERHPDSDFSTKVSCVDDLLGPLNYLSYPLGFFLLENNSIKWMY